MLLGKVHNKFCDGSHQLTEKISAMSAQHVVELEHANLAAPLAILHRVHEIRSLDLASLIASMIRLVAQVDALLEFYPIDDSEEASGDRDDDQPVWSIQLMKYDLYGVLPQIGVP